MLSLRWKLFCLQKKNITISIAILTISMVMSGCGEVAENSESTPELNLELDLSNAKDGIFEGESSLDRALGRGYVTLEIKDHKIVGASYVGKDLFGNDKDENYGGDQSSADYRKAQVAVKAIDKYVMQLADTQSLEQVDAISGATISYIQFIEATQDAVSKASR